MPALVLKKMVMGNFDKGVVDEEIADSIDFMVQSVCRYQNVAHL
jgi:maspardin